MVSWLSSFCRGGSRAAPTIAPTSHSRRTLRLKNYDYTSPGAYFVTICTQDRLVSLGSVENGTMHLSRLGETAAEWWQWLQGQYPWITLDQWVVMPNHLHGIIIIRRGESRLAPTD